MPLFRSLSTTGNNSSAVSPAHTNNCYYLYRTEGFAAIKVTALGNPELLMRISQILVASRKLFREFAAHDAPRPAPGTEGQQHQQPFIGSTFITKANFIKALELLKVRMTQQEIEQLFQKMARAFLFSSFPLSFLFRIRVSFSFSRSFFIFL